MKICGKNLISAISLQKTNVVNILLWPIPLEKEPHDRNFTAGNKGLQQNVLKRIHREIRQSGTDADPLQ